ncbi:MAG: GNAT family N-acetyltransferase [Cyanobacteria bacterium KgW148]|nr:GNAT family N-acetyltransferase [Cyanobacteria bacterium KgW148]
MRIIQVAVNSREYQQALNLRNLYLRQPLGIIFTKQELSQEPEAVHVVACEGDRVVGCGLGLRQNEWIKIRQMIVHPDYQNQGIGSSILQCLEQIFYSQNYRRFYLHSRYDRRGFYQKNGYQSVGDPFLEVGIVHQRMEKFLP